MVAAVDDLGFAENDDPSEDLAYEVDAKSDLELLAEDVAEKVAAPTRVRHPGNPAYVLLFRSNIETAEAISIEKRTAKKAKPVRERNALFLAVTNVGLEKNGKPVENSKGHLVNFRDPELLQAFGVATASAAVVKFFGGNDGHLIGVADKVAEGAGFGADIEVVEDPTELA